MRIARMTAARWSSSAGSPLQMRRTFAQFCSGVCSWETPAVATMANWFTAFSSDRWAFRSSAERRSGP
jgi:hypothetical protein